MKSYAPRARALGIDLARDPSERYRILGRIAAGGMAEIYLARMATRSGGWQEVVLKRLLPDLQEDAEFVQMFYDEARIAAGMLHGNIVQIFELGELDGSLFISMELIRGVNLKELIERGQAEDKPMPLAIAVRIASGALDALGFAHDFTDEKGSPLKVVHRDVSPQNILVTYQGEVKLVDFGVARAEGRLHQTRQGLVKGKFAYMAPEQINGDPIDGRTDLFALAEVLYLMAVGRHPFYADSDAAVLQRVLEAKPSPPVTLDPKFPPGLAAILLRGMQRRPAERYPTAQDFKAALDAFLQDRARPPTAETVGRYVRELFQERLRLEEQARSDDDDALLVESMRVGPAPRARPKSATKRGRSRAREEPAPTRKKSEAPRAARVEGPSRGTPRPEVKILPAAITDKTPLPRPRERTPAAADEPTRLAGAGENASSVESSEEGFADERTVNVPPEVTPARPLPALEDRVRAGVRAAEAPTTRPPIPVIDRRLQEVVLDPLGRPVVPGKSGKEPQEATVIDPGGRLAPRPGEVSARSSGHGLALPERGKSRRKEDGPADVAGQKVGKYTLVRRLGMGAMAEVFLARQVGPQGFEKRVALKRILPQLASEADFVERFLHEAKLAAELNHPNIVQILDLGLEDGTYFLALEYVHGWDLGKVLARTKLLGKQVPPAIAARIIADVSAGLAAAHGAIDDLGDPMPVLHRDVAPANILLSSQGVVKLSDFGLAKAQHSAQVTTDQIPGRPAYMAPERFQPDKQGVDARADVFSTAIVLYELLTLESPFTRATTFETMLAVLRDTPPSLSARRPDVPRALEAALERALAKSPAERTPSAQAFGLEMERFLARTGEPVTQAHLAEWLRELFVPVDRGAVNEEILTDAGMTVASELRRSKP